MFVQKPLVGAGAANDGGGKVKKQNIFLFFLFLNCPLLAAAAATTATTATGWGGGGDGGKKGVKKMTPPPQKKSFGLPQKFLTAIFFLKIYHATSSNLYRFYYPHRSRELVSPVCGIFFLFIKIWLHADSSSNTKKIII